MATKPTVNQKAVGSKATAADWNNGVYRQWQFIDVAKPVCWVTQGVTQALGAATFTALTMDAESVDIDGQHSTSTNTSRVVIGNTLGWYRCWGVTHFAPGVNARIGARIALNGTALTGTECYAQTGGTSTFVSAQSQGLVQATISTDYVEFQAYTSAAASTSVSGAMRPTFLVEYLGTLQ